MRTEADEPTTSLRGLLLSSWVQTEADEPTTSLRGLPSSLCVTQGRGSSDEPTWLIVCTAVVVSPKDPTPARSGMRGGGVGVNASRGGAAVVDGTKMPHPWLTRASDSLQGGVGVVDIDEINEKDPTPARSRMRGGGLVLI